MESAWVRVLGQISITMCITVLATEQSCSKKARFCQPYLFFFFVIYSSDTSSTTSFSSTDAILDPMPGCICIHDDNAVVEG